MKNQALNLVILFQIFSALAVIAVTPDSDERPLKISTLETTKSYKNNPEFSHYAPWKGQIFSSFPCQRSCAYVRNKARYATRENDLGIASQAYINAKNGFKSNRFETLLNCFSLAGVAVGSAIMVGGRDGSKAFEVASKAVLPILSVLGAAELYQILRVQGPNAYFYWSLKRELRKYIVKVAGQEAFDKLDKIKSYSSDDGAEQYKEWLEEQRIRLTFRTVPSTADPEGPGAETCVSYSPANDNNV